MSTDCFKPYVIGCLQCSIHTYAFCSRSYQTRKYFVTDWLDVTGHLATANQNLFVLWYRKSISVPGWGATRLRPNRTHNGRVENPCLFRTGGHVRSGQFGTKSRARQTNLRRLLHARCRSSLLASPPPPMLDGPPPSLESYHGCRSTVKVGP